MKFTVTFFAFLSISSTWAIEIKNEDPKDKREAPLGYPSGLSHSYQAPIGHEGASAISVGAGYSVGGAKPYSFAGHASSAPLQLSSEGLQPSGHATYKLPPITLQSDQGYASGDLSQLMSQLSHSINSGALNLQSGQLSAAGLEYAPAAQGDHGQEIQGLPQYTFAAPQLAQYAVSEQPSVPSYSAGSKGLGSYGSTGPVLFTPSEAQTNAGALNYAPASGHSLGDATGAGIAFGSAPGSGHSFGGLSFGGSGHSLGGLSLGGHAQALGGHSQALGGHVLSGGHSLGGNSLGGNSLGGHSLGGNSFGGHSFGGHSLGGALGGHSLGGAGLYGGSFKNSGGSYTVPSKSSFKPSAYLGAVQGDSGHSLSGLSGSHGAPSFSSLSGGGHGGLSLGSGGHGASFGGNFGGSSTKYHASAYAPSKPEGLGSLESVSSFASGGHNPSHGASFGSSPYAHLTAAHSASSNSPQYYVPSSKYSSSSSFGEGSSSHRAPHSSHSPLSSYSSSPKHSFGGRGTTRYAAPKDAHGSYSENSYNTIKYSEEIRPVGH